MSAPASAPAPQGGKTAMLVGATGAVGKEILSALRSSGDFTSIHSIVRRPDSTPSAVAGTNTNAPVTVKEHVVDFEKLLSDDASTAAEEAGKLRAVSADCVFISLGTTRAAAGSAEKFERIDREYVIAAAKAARREEQGHQQGGSEEGKTTTTGQTLLYVSSSGASSKLPLLYPKSKGLTEEALVSLHYPLTLLFRPGFLYGAQRDIPRKMEHYYGLFTHNVLSHLTSSAEIPTKSLGAAMVWSGARGLQGLQQLGVGSKPSGAGYNQVQQTQARILSNAETLKIAKQASSSS